MTATLSVTLPTFASAPGGDWRGLLDLARAAEDAGVHRVVVTDHVVMGRHTENYLWGRFPTPPDAPWTEPLTVLTAMAAVTSTIRLATGILIAPLRPAVLLAKTVATLDHLSGGRVDLGVGTGWQREEYDAEGLDWARRGRLLTDTLAACRALWTQVPASFASPTISFDDVFCVPQPVQAPLPVWFSGVLHERNVRRIVELGDGWIPIMGSTVDDVAAGASRLRSALADAGRDPSALRVQGSPAYARRDDGTFDIAGTLASVPALVEAGATDIALNLRTFCPDLADAPGVLNVMATEFAAAVGRP